MRKNLLLMMAVGAWVGAMAAPLTPQEALARLGGNTRAGATSELRLAYTSNQADGEAAIYVFNNQKEGGYLFLSADDCAAPLLGYADSGKFEENRMSPELKWWLGEYSRQIEYAKANGITEYVAMTTRADRAAIAPMVKSKWNQDAPYNGMTPTVNGKHCVTGCVATATAQVMNYWKYPEVGKGTGECTVQDDNDKETTDQMDFSKQKFDWANMLDVYTSSATQVQKDAVAYLMKAAGYGVKMTYTSYESGAADIYVATTLIENFGYNKNLQYCQRDYYSPTEWENMVYDELAAGRPIVYGGQSTLGGHCFVCDGYSSDGYYHFNWGWGGMSDGYFILNALDPGSLGIGANGGGYNFYQDMVRGIQPQTGTDLGANLLVDGLMTATVSGNQLVITIPGLFNYTGKAITFDLGAILVNESGQTVSSVAVNGGEGINLQVGYGWGGEKPLEMPVILSTSLPNGTYKVYPAIKLAGSSTWNICLSTQLEYNYVVVTKNSNRFTVKENKAQSVKVTDGGVVSKLVYGQASKLTITVSNPTDREVSQSFYPVLCTGVTPVLEAEGVTINIPAGGTVTKEFDCLFEPADDQKAPTTDTTYKLKFYDPAAESSSGHWYYKDFSKDVTMTIGTKPALMGQSLSLPGVKMENGTYIIEDLSKVPVSCTVSNTGGYFNNPIAMYMMVPNGANLISVAEYALGTLELATGGKGTVETTVDMSGLDDGEYTVLVRGNNGWIYGSDGVYTHVFVKVSTAGVGEVTVNDEITVSYDHASGIVTVVSESGVKGIELYSLEGKRCNAAIEQDGASATANVNALPAGAYLVKATARNGASKTVKILK